jgi:hypothetical protein
MTRREFHRLTLLAGMSLLGGEGRGDDGSTVALVKTGDRNYGVHRAVELLGGADFGGRGVYLKASYNSADPLPPPTPTPCGRWSGCSSAAAPAGWSWRKEAGWGGLGR